MKLNVLFLFSFMRGRVIKMRQNSLCISTCLLTLSLRKTQIGVFREYFSFNCFLTAFCWFWKLRLDFLNSALTFTQNQPNFFGQKELVGCWAANLSSKNCLYFFKNFKRQYALSHCKHFCIRRWMEGKHKEKTLFSGSLQVLHLDLFLNP